MEDINYMAKNLHENNPWFAGIPVHAMHPKSAILHILRVVAKGKEQTRTKPIAYHSANLFV